MKIRRLPLLSSLLLLPFAGPALAQEAPEKAQQVSIETAQVAQPAADPAADPDPWRLQGTLYGWAIGVSGNVTARGQTVDVNATFPQIMQKSDSIAAFMGNVEASKGRVGVYGDFVWAKLGFDKGMASYRNPLPGLQLSATTNTALTTTLTVLEAGGFYEFGRWQHGGGSATSLDGILGFRYWNIANEIDLNVIGSVNVPALGLEFGRAFSVARANGVDWVDPILGLRLRHQFTPSQQVMLRGDIGGFGFGSAFTWQAAAVYSYNWQFTGYSLAALVGYRALGVSYSEGWGLNTAGIDAVFHGPLIGASLRF